VKFRSGTVRWATIRISLPHGLDGGGQDRRKLLSDIVMAAFVDEISCSRHDGALVSAQGGWPWVSASPPFRVVGQVCPRLEDVRNTAAAAAIWSVATHQEAFRAAIACDGLRHRSRITRLTDATVSTRLTDATVSRGVRVTTKSGAKRRRRLGQAERGMGAKVAELEEPDPASHRAAPRKREKR
jgi:hypothetical protein